MARRVGIPRWSLTALFAAVAMVCGVTGESFAALFAGLLTLVLLLGDAIAWLVQRRGTRADGDLAYALFVGYALGQWTPAVF
jgi:hypothetical protein